MGTTTRAGLRYPEQTDVPNVAQDIQDLAQDVEGGLYRAFPCTDSTRPPLGSVGEGFLLDVIDLGTVEIARGGSWAVVSGPVSSSGGSGGGGSSSTAVGTVSATYAATAAQPIASNVDVVVAFGVAQTTDSSVTRAAQGAGHKFTVSQTRLWTVSATLRFAQNAVGGRTFELRTGTNAVLAKASGPQDTDAPWTCNLAVSRRLAAGTSLYVVAHHNSTSGIALEPNGGDTVHLDLAGV